MRERSISAWCVGVFAAAVLLAAGLLAFALAPPPEKEGIIHMIGFVLLMGLMVFVLFNDIMRLFG